LGGWRRLDRNDSMLASQDRFYLVRLTWRRARVFNRWAAAAGESPVSIWRNAHFYLRLANALCLRPPLRRASRPSPANAIESDGVRGPGKSRTA